jgi:hypothetical protein
VQPFISLLLSSLSFVLSGFLLVSLVSAFCDASHFWNFPRQFLHTKRSFSNIIINIAPKHTNSPRPFVILCIKRTRHDSLDKEDKKKEKVEDQAERARLGSDYDSVV